MINKYDTRISNPIAARSRWLLHVSIKTVFSKNPDENKQTAIDVQT